MTKKHMLLLTCFLLITAVVFRLNYETGNKKESTVNSQYSNKYEGKISMTSRRATYPSSIQEIYVTIENNTLVDYYANLAYTIEYLRGSAWDKVPLSFAVNYPLGLLPPSESEEFTIYLYHNQYNYKPGTYRVLKTVESSSKDTQVLFCEFNLE